MGLLWQLNDAVRETVIISHAISGGGYDTVSMASFTATMIDDDTAGITTVSLTASLSFTPVTVTICGRLQLRRVKVSTGVTVAAVVSLLVNLMVTLD
jgi:hypothetical protein